MGAQSADKTKVTLTLTTAYAVGHATKVVYTKSATASQNIASLTGAMLSCWGVDNCLKEDGTAVAYTNNLVALDLGAGVIAATNNKVVTITTNKAITGGTLTKGDFAVDIGGVDKSADVDTITKVDGSDTSTPAVAGKITITMKSDKPFAAGATVKVKYTKSGTAAQNLLGLGGAM